MNINLIKSEINSDSSINEIINTNSYESETYVKKLYQNQFKDIRELKDISTSYYTYINFSNKRNSSILFKFIDCIYHYINSCIIININKEIILSNELPLNNEKIIIILKGGNSMYINFINYLKENNELNNKFDNEIKSKFKISDNDFSIYIITKNEIRYNLIYKIVSKYLIKALKEISIKFDEFYNNPQNNNIIEYNNIAEINNINNINKINNVIEILDFINIDIILYNIQNSDNSDNNKNKILKILNVKYIPYYTEYYINILEKFKKNKDIIINLINTLLDLVNEQNYIKLNNLQNFYKNSGFTNQDLINKFTQSNLNNTKLYNHDQQEIYI